MVSSGNDLPQVGGYRWGMIQGNGAALGKCWGLSAWRAAQQRRGERRSDFLLVCWWLSSSRIFTRFEVHTQRALKLFVIVSNLAVIKVETFDRALIALFAGF
jgi:hypothetical protein